MICTCLYPLSPFLSLFCPHISLFCPYFVRTCPCSIPIYGGGRRTLHGLVDMAARSVMEGADGYSSRWLATQPVVKVGKDFLSRVGRYGCCSCLVVLLWRWLDDILLRGWKSWLLVLLWIWHNGFVLWNIGIPLTKHTFSLQALQMDFWREKNTTYIKKQRSFIKDVMEIINVYKESYKYISLIYVNKGTYEWEQNS